MADVEIISEDGVYYTICVTVNDVEYIQTITTDKKGVALAALLQSYADDYQSGINLQNSEDL